MPAPRICVQALAAALLAGRQTPPPASPEVVSGYRKDSGYLNGCLGCKQLPDSLTLLPPAGGGGFVAARLRPGHRQAHARAARHAMRTLAAKDANLKFPATASTFECALQIPISQEGTPNLNMLLQRTLLDAGLATYAAKDKYQRALPFVAEKTSTCTAAEDAALAKDGSYASGHASLGWAWALVLVDAGPQRMDALLQRGHAFSQSRVVCGVHWQSDVDAGRVIGAAAVARLHADDTFRAQVAPARDEVTQAQAKGLKPSADSAAEAAALALR